MKKLKILLAACLAGTFLNIQSMQEKKEITEGITIRAISKNIPCMKATDYFNAKRNSPKTLDLIKNTEQLEKRSYWDRLQDAAKSSMIFSGLLTGIYAIGIPLERRHLISFEQLKHTDHDLAKHIKTAANAVNIDPYCIEYNLSGREKAAVSPTIYPKILNFHPAELKKMTTDMISFGIAHELIHIKKHHVAKQMVYWLLAPITGMHLELAGEYYSKFVDRSIFSLQQKFGYENNWLINQFRSLHSSVATSQITHLLIHAYIWQKLSTSFEKEADIEAAIALKSAKGGMDLFISLADPSNLFMKFYQKVIDPHPSHISRYLYLYRLQEQLEAQK